MHLTHTELMDKDPEQVDLLIAYTELEKDLGSHGHFMSETTSPDAEPTNYEAEHPVRYVAHPIIDQAQAAINRARKELQAENPDLDISDRVFAVEKITY